METPVFWVQEYSKGRKMSLEEDKVVVLNLAVFAFWLKLNNFIENNLTHNLSQNFSPKQPHMTMNKEIPINKFSAEC